MVIRKIFLNQLLTLKLLTRSLVPSRCLVITTVRQDSGPDVLFESPFLISTDLNFISFEYDLLSGQH